jgi:hypothetical protein
MEVEAALEEGMEAAAALGVGVDAAGGGGHWQV